MTARGKKSVGLGRVSPQIEAAVASYVGQRAEFDMFARTLLLNLTDSASVKGLIHSTKWRTKDPDHLRDKLRRKATDAIQSGKKFDINADNLFMRIEDLAGVRLLHLHTKQMADIHGAVMSVLGEHKYKVVGKAVANTWDIENQEFFKSLDLRTNLRPSMYTSVHYIVRANRRTEMRCELQVRTLMEEVWGEVSHAINYPKETEIVCCREQLRVLARAASACTRLVDAIFTSHVAHRQESQR